jgi:hypothetical protein
MSSDIMLEKKNIPSEGYDPACEDLGVALRAILKLPGRYRGRDCLAELGIDEAHAEELLNIRMIVSGRPTGEECNAVLSTYPWLKRAAETAIKLYVSVMAPERVGKVALQYA